MLLAVFVLAGAGCDRLGGPTIAVEFSSAGGLGAGRPVYVAGVEVGRTGPPEIVAGKARVPVTLQRRQEAAVRGGAVFAIAADPNEPGERCLVAEALPTAQPVARDGIEVYQGVGSEAELRVLVGVQRARALWNDLTAQSAESHR